MSIAVLYLRDFLKLVFIAIIIASPLSYFFEKSWLQDFTYRIDMGWQLFLVGALIALCIALVTVGFQVVKAATVITLRI